LEDQLYEQTQLNGELDLKVQQLMQQLKNSRVKVEADVEANIQAKNTELQNLK
jgi:hypothetical protein